ncbi:hypothetical protein ACSBR2_021967 [Camellia fascicularis]
MQTGMGLSKILILVGARYTSMILVKNGKLSDILGEIQSLVKGMEKNGESSESDSYIFDAIASQVHQLAMEVQQLASARQITVLNGNSSQISNLTSLIVPAAVVGVLCYGCMWWKGLTFSNLMYVTKRNMANAVSNLTKHLESATKRHLTQRVENLDGKLDEQVEYQRCSYIIWQQELANLGVLYLCNFADGRKVKMLEVLHEQLKLPGKPRGYLNSSEPPSLMGLKEIADSLVSGNANWLITDDTMREGIERLDDQPRTLMSTTSTKC